MKRKTSKSSRYKKAIWTKEQRLQAVSTYLMLGNMAETAIVTSIPLPTLKSWKTTDWFKEYALQLQAEDIQKMDSKLKKVIDKALRSVEDRLDNGDAQFDQRTGDIVRVPIKAHVALKISTELMTKQQKLQDDASGKEDVQATINDRLLKLSEEFARFASNKFKPAKTIVDVETVQIKEPLQVENVHQA
jgi:hypothetical protein